MQQIKFDSSKYHYSNGFHNIKKDSSSKPVERSYKLYIRRNTGTVFAYII